MLKLVGFTLASIFTAEALVMLFVESFGDRLALPLRVALDATLLMVCVIPTLYFLVFKEMAEQVRLRNLAQQAQRELAQGLEQLVAERTERLQRANEDLLVEVQERAKAAMALRSALNEARAERQQRDAILDAVRDALVVVNGAWQILVVNPAAESLFGTSAYDLQGRSIKEVLSSWAPEFADLVLDFEPGGKDQCIDLVRPPGRGQGRRSVRLSYGATLTWEGQPAKALTFSCRDDLHDETVPYARIV